jgi:hypothetical protein
LAPQESVATAEEGEKEDEEEEEETEEEEGEEEEEEETKQTADVRIFNALLGLVEPSAAEGVVGRMKALQVSPNMHTIDLLITHFESGDRIDRLWSLLRELQDAKVIHPDDIIYNSFIKVSLRRGQTDRAYSMLTQLLAAGTPLPLSSFHLFLEPTRSLATSKNQKNAGAGTDEDELKRRTSEQAALIPKLVQLMYRKNPTAPFTALLPYIHFCVQNRIPEKLETLMALLEQKSGRGAALVDNVLAIDDDSSFTSSSNSRSGNTTERAMYRLAPMLKAYVLMHRTDKAIELIRAIRGRGIKVEAHVYRALMQLANPDSPGSALLLRALMREDRVPDEDEQDPFVPLEDQVRSEWWDRNHRRRRRGRRLSPVESTPHPDPDLDVDTIFDPEHRYENRKARERTDRRQPATTATTAPQESAEEPQQKKEKKEKKEKVKREEEAEASLPRTRPPPGAIPRPPDLLSLSFSLLGSRTPKAPHRP